MALKQSMKAVYYGLTLAVLAILFPDIGHAQDRLRPIDGCEVMPGLSVDDVAQGKDLIPPALRTGIIGGTTACRWEKQIAGGKRVYYRAYYETRIFGTVPVVVYTAAPYGVVISSIYLGPDAVVDFDRPNAMVKSPTAICYLATHQSVKDKLTCSQDWDKYVQLFVAIPASGPPQQYLKILDDFTVKSVTIRSGEASVELLADYNPDIIQVSKSFKSVGSSARPVIMAALQSGTAELVRTAEDGTITVEAVDMKIPKMSFNILNQVAKVMGAAANQTAGQ